MGERFTVADADAFYVLRAFQKQVKAALEFEKLEA